MSRPPQGAELLCGIAAYFVSSLGSLAIVKLLNYSYCLTSWLLFALVSTSTWLLGVPLHLSLERLEGISVTVSWKQLRLYGFIAVGLSCVELLNSLTLSVLPGSWYALLKGSDVGFFMALSRLILGKVYPWGQLVGATLVMGGIAMVFVLGSVPSSQSGAEESSPASPTSVVSVTMAAALCLFGAFLNAVCAVLTEGILKETLKEEEEEATKLLEQQQLIQPYEPSDSSIRSPPSKLHLSNAYFMWTSSFSFAMLLIPTLLSGQLFGRQSLHGDDDGPDDGRNSIWSCNTHQENAVSGDGTLSSSVDLGHSGTSTYPLVAIIGFLMLLTASRFTERLSKHLICVADSAVTFSLVQAARRLSGVFVLALLFREDFPPLMVVGSTCSALGFAVHYWYGRHHHDHHHHREPVHSIDRTRTEAETTIRQNNHHYELVERRDIH